MGRRECIERAVYGGRIEEVLNNPRKYHSCPSSRLRSDLSTGSTALRYAPPRYLTYACFSFSFSLCFFLSFPFLIFLSLSLSPSSFDSPTLFSYTYFSLFSVPPFLLLPPIPFSSQEKHKQEQQNNGTPACAATTHGRGDRNVISLMWKSLDHDPEARRRRSPL